ncbi:MAG: hypothetical protein HC806_03235, partial [Anaerolineae bacterium]|nr:hypothetical protein [Anaerolineae bacterium]
MKRATFRRFLSFILAITFCLTILGESGARPVVAAPWQTRVDPWVIQSSQESGETEFLVFLSEQADLSDAGSLKTKIEKGTYVYQVLTGVAERTQPPVIEALELLGADYQPFWVANMIWVRGNLATVQAMAQRSDVARVYANPVVRFETLPIVEQKGLLEPSTVEWNLLMVNADDVWAEGVTGEGAVIGGHDTGYDWDHPALIHQYRGW